MKETTEIDKIKKAYVNGYRRCVRELREKGIVIHSIEATADYLPIIIENNPKEYELL